MARRGENIRKRKDGRWEARILCSSVSEGKSRYLYIYARSYQEVRRKRNEKIAELTKSNPLSEVPSVDKGSVTVKTLMNSWLSGRRPFIREFTYAVYSMVINRHILPELGELYVSQLHAETVNQFLMQKLQTGRVDRTGGLSPKTVADIRSVLRMALDYAGEQGYDCDVNCRLFSPKITKPKITILSLAEQQQLEQYLYRQADCFSAGILLTMYSGLRIGEICALQWRDIDFSNGTLTVSKTLLRIHDFQNISANKTRLVVQNPKTECSVRTIPLPHFILPYLEQFRLSETAFVLTGNEQPMEARCCLGKYKRLLAQASLRDFTFHALRHTFATRCIESGFDVKSLSEILGHASVNITLQRYVHPSMEQKQRQMNLLENLSVRGQKNGTPSHNA